jgi:hypothetical protein
MGIVYGDAGNWPCRLGVGRGQKEDLSGRSAVQWFGIHREARGNGD